MLSTKFLRSAVRNSGIPLSVCSSQSRLPLLASSLSLALPQSTNFTGSMRQFSTSQSSANNIGIRELNIGGTREVVYERSAYPLAKLRSTIGTQTFAVLGYGPQGRGQALNLRDQGFNVVIGLREGKSWELAVADGFQPGKSLFSIEEAAKRGSIVMLMLSDAGQKLAWNSVKPHLTKGKTLYVSHGFSIVYRDFTGVIPPSDIDVVMVAPKGSGTSVRELFLKKTGINSSYAVYQDFTGNAAETARSVGFAIGSGYMFNTTFDNETTSDLVGERGVLMGGILGMFKAQYEVLRENGHKPSEAFNETVEEFTQSLIVLVSQNGLAWMYRNCSTTAQRGALDWYPKFESAVRPVFKELYSEVKNGNEAKRTLECNSRDDYRVGLEAELKQIENHEMWRVGEILRQLRPENSLKSSNNSNNSNNNTQMNYNEKDSRTGGKSN